MSGVKRLSWDSRGEFDEIVGEGTFHGERMDDDYYWFGFDGVMLNITVRRRWFRRPVLHIEVEDYRHLPLPTVEPRSSESAP